MNIRRRNSLIARLVAISMCITASACESDDFRAKIVDPQYDSSATLSIDSVGESPADGTSLIRIVVRLSGNPTATRIVNLSTTAGTFWPGALQTASVAVGGSDTSVVLLRAPRDSSVATLRIASGATNRVYNVQFKAALPDTLLLQPRDSFVVTGNVAAQTTFIATLRRSNGKVSPGAGVTFTDSLPAGKGGVFGTATLSDTLERSEVRYAIGAVDSIPRGSRKIYACTRASRGGLTCGSTTIFFR